MIRPLALLVAQTLAVISILASLLVLAGRHPARIDLTPDSSLTLSPHTHQVLSRLRQPVTATAFTSGQEQAIRAEIEQLLALYRDAQPALSLRILDLDRNPGEAERLGVSNYNVVVLEAGGRRERVDLVNEDTLTAGLLALSGRPDAVAYMVQGHGEPGPRDLNDREGWGDAAAALVSDGFEIRPLPGAAHIPPDAGVVILAGATRDLQPAEVDALEAHVRGGGRLLVLADPGAPRSVTALLERFGIIARNDVVVDGQARLFGTDGLSARVAYLNERLVPDAPSSSALLPLAQTLELEERPGLDAEFLAMTDETTWADAGSRDDAAERAFRAGTDRRGPLPVGAIVRARASDGREGRLVAIGDADFATNLRLALLGNRDLLLVAAEVAARADDALTASRRQPGTAGPFSTLALTARQARFVFWTACVVPAALFIGGAALVALQRRRAA